MAAGLILMIWPAATWAYGIYWQARLARELPPMPASDVALVPPATVPPPRPSAPPSALASGMAAAVRRAAEAVPSLPPPPPPPSRTPPSAEPRPLPGGAFARLHIPRIGLDAVVVEGDDARSLRRGPGHLPRTGRPGEPRNCAIAAHRDGWFARLDEVEIGDAVRVRTRERVFEYEVWERRVVTPDRGDLLERGPFPDLTLITCTGPGYPNSKYRLLVFCRLREGP